MTNFVLFEGLPSVITRFGLFERDYGMAFPAGDIELVFVELPKFNKLLDQLDTLIDNWLYFIRQADQLKEAPVPMTQVRPIAKAFDLANEANLSVDELIDMENRSRYIYEWEKGLEKAEELGIERGWTRGLEQGLEQGHYAGIVQSILRMLVRRFAVVPKQWEARLWQVPMEALEQVLDAAWDAEDLADFERMLGQVSE